MKAGPQASQIPANFTHCKPEPIPGVALDIPCCWATVTAGAICNQNRQLISNINDELTSDHIHTELRANITLMLNNQFNITVHYFQPYFPLYFGQTVLL